MKELIQADLNGVLDSLDRAISGLKFVESDIRDHFSGNEVSLQRKQLEDIRTSINAVKNLFIDHENMPILP